MLDLAAANETLARSTEWRIEHALSSTDQSPCLQLFRKNSGCWEGKILVAELPATADLATILSMAQVAQHYYLWGRAKGRACF